MALPQTPDPALSADELGMKAQAGLLPYALIAFGISLPIFVWGASHAADAAWMSAVFAVFAMAWGVFYAVVNWLKTEAAANLAARARVQVMGGLVWAAVIAATLAGIVAMVQ